MMGMTQQELDSKTLFEVVPTSKTFVAKYGRPLAVAKVQRIARAFDERAIGTVYLSLRNNGKYAILDGQHRIAAANLKGIRELPARVFIDLTYEEEAELYVKFATVNKQSSLDRWKARVEAQEPKVKDITDLLDSIGLSVSYSGQSEGTLQAVSVIEDIYDKNGRAHLRNILATIYRTWQGAPRAYTQSILQGLSAFLLRYESLTIKDDGVKLDWHRLTDSLANMTPDSLIAKAQQLKGILSQSESRYAIGQVILFEYNKGLKTKRLPEWSNRVMKKAEQ